MRFSSRSGIAMAAVLVIVIVVVAVGGVGAYYVITSSAPSSSSTTSQSSSMSTSSGQSTTQSSSSGSSQASSSGSTTTTTSAQSSSQTSYSTSITTCSGTTYSSYTQTVTSTTTINPLTFDIGFINQFKAMTVGFNGTSGNSTSSDRFSYVVVATSGNLKEVNFTLTASGGSSSSTTGGSAWVDTSALSVINFTEVVSSGGQNYHYTVTGTQAQSLFTAEMEIFYIYQSTYGSTYIGLFTSSQFFHSTGTSSVTLGPTTFQVTTYEANNTPEIINVCTSVFSFNSYELQVGTPQGSSVQFITRIHFSGSQVTNGNTVNEDFDYQLLSLTLA